MARRSAGVILLCRILFRQLPRPDSLRDHIDNLRDCLFRVLVVFLKKLYAFTARTCVSGLRSLERRYDGHAAASIADLGDVDAGGAGGRTHTFMGAVTFGKAGAETLQVTQADDPKVRGRTTFAIA